MANPIKTNLLQGVISNPLTGFSNISKKVNNPMISTNQGVNPGYVKQQVAPTTNLGNIRAIPQVAAATPYTPSIDTNHSFSLQVTPGVPMSDIGRGTVQTNKNLSNVYAKGTEQVKKEIGKLSDDEYALGKELKSQGASDLQIGKFIQNKRKLGSLSEKEKELGKKLKEEGKTKYEISEQLLKNRNSIVDYLGSGLQDEKRTGDMKGLKEKGIGYGAGVIEGAVEPFRQGANIAAKQSENLDDILSAVTGLYPEEEYEAKELPETAPAIGKGLGVDTDSEGFKTGRIIGNITSAAIPVEGAFIGASTLVKGAKAIKGAKTVAKETTKLAPEVAKLLGETTNAKNVGKAIANPKMGTIQYQPRTGFSKWLLGDRQLKLLPSETSQIAQDIVAQRVKKPSGNPQVLNGQIDDVIRADAETLSTNLKTVKPNTMKGKSRDTQLKILDYIVNNDDLLLGEVKKLKNLINKMDAIKNADDIWNIRKDYDRLFPQRVKDNPLSKGYTAWMEGRTVLNDLVEDLVATAGEESAKKTWSDMKALYTAKKNIQSNATQLIKGSEGIASPKNVVRAGLGAVGLNTIGSFIGL